jgi:CubicO group peptidase (beta-lactamase class C family)
MLGADWLSPYGPDTRYAFGHLGFTNIISWADPERQVAAALMTSGKPLIYPEIYYLFDVLRQIGIACTKTQKRRVSDTQRPAILTPHTGRGAREIPSGASEAAHAPSGRPIRVTRPKRSRAGSPALPVPVHERSLFRPRS